MASEGGLLHGRYIPSFNPNTDELPDPNSLEHKLFTHDIGKIAVCDLKENRYRISDFYDVEEGKKYEQIYCWKGIISRTGGGDCKIGTVCDPNSYVGARTRFCLTWGCKDPFSYVADDQGQPVINERNGIVVYTKKSDCEGGFVNQLECFVNSLRQSADYILDPVNRRAFMIQMIVLAAIVTVGLITLIRFRRSKNKRLVKLRKSLTPKWSKTKPLFPKQRR